MFAPGFGRPGDRLCDTGYGHCAAEKTGGHEAMFGSGSMGLTNLLCGNASGSIASYQFFAVMTTNNLALGNVPSDEISQMNEAEAC